MSYSGECRSCGHATVAAISLGKMPLANRLLFSPDESYQTYPLDVDYCENCTLLQLRETVDPKQMFREYNYYTSVNGPMVESARVLVDRMIQSSALRDGGSNKLVVEVGSNDGYLLQWYKQWGIAVLGIDPAYGPAAVAMEKGIATVTDFFDSQVARVMQKADVIHCHNVLAHVSDVNDFVAGLATMLRPCGVIVVEVPAAEDMIDKGTFDQIYFEHVFYFTLQSLTALFARHGLAVEHYENIESHGGSFRLFVQHTAEHPVIALSEGFKPKSLSNSAKKIRHDLHEWFQAPHPGVWGFGAAAKATVMLNYCGIDAAILPFVVDQTPAKIGKFIPGTSQEVVSVERWLQAQPEWTCILAWNYEKEIRARYRGAYHGRFFTPYQVPTEVTTR